MFKKLDLYILRTYLGPFFFIFSILFFIFSVQFAFIEISKVVGKGLTFFEIAKLLFYLGTTVIPMVVPLTVLLASIMCFGGFGERYELAAMKSTGISLARIMRSIFIFCCIVGVGLFLFSNNVLTENQKKAKNLLFNIANSKPALRFVSGQFTSNIPGFTMRIDSIYGENSDQLNKVMIHKQASAYEDQTTIIADHGILRSTNDKQYLRFELYNGYMYDAEIEGKDYSERLKQPLRTTKFDTLSIYMDISELVNKALDEENISEHFRFLNYVELEQVIDSTKIAQDSIFKFQSGSVFRNITSTPEDFDSLYVDFEAEDYTEPFVFNELDKEKKQKVLTEAINQIKMNESSISTQVENIMWEKRQKARIIIHQQRIFAFSFMCIIFFLVGAPLGSIIRKGGIGIPVLISIIIFLIWFTIIMYTETEAKLGRLNPYVAAWLPNFIILPLGIFLTKKAMEDSELFDIDKYKKAFQNLKGKFMKTKNSEHSRYQ
jgi:lipopolysaccharide export system permease protein